MLSIRAGDSGLAPRAGPTRCFIIGPRQPASRDGIQSYRPYTIPPARRAAPARSGDALEERVPAINEPVRFTAYYRCRAQHEAPARPFEAGTPHEATISTASRTSTVRSARFPARWGLQAAMLRHCPRPDMGSEPRRSEVFDASCAHDDLVALRPLSVREETVLAPPPQKCPTSLRHVTEFSLNHRI